MSQLNKNIIVLFFALLLIAPCFSQNRVYSFKSDSSSVWKRTLISAGEVFTINMGVWAFDRYVSKSEFSYINGRTIKSNFREGFGWDNDCMGTNLLMHPYHGSLYFNTARSNGFSFYQSIPFNLGGSLMWEFFLENEPPSINDLLSTTFAGSMFGEVSFRVSNLIIDNSATGANRVFREIFAGLVSPIHELNRLLSGNAWRRNALSYYDKPSFDFNISAGTRWLKPQINENYDVFGEISAALQYNSEREDLENPYDWFNVDMAVDFRKSTIYVRRMNVSALLWSRPFKMKPNRTFDVGIYQNLNYWDSSTKSYQRTPFRFSQTVAVGPGINYTSTSRNQKSKLNFTTIVNVFGLGGSITDYYWVGSRDYNFGSGFSVQTNLSINLFNSRIRFNLKADNYTLYTWDTYSPKRDLFKENLEELDSQGDKGHVNFTTVEASLGYYSKCNWNIELMTDFINRCNHYTYYPSRNYNTFSYGVRIGYNLK